jgi:HPt (histidine-containing phosphotransfer) domain-containing protein
MEGLNLGAGLARIGGNRTLYRKLLLQFLHDYRDVIETIRTALELEHRESGLRLLHTLKGVAATIGAERVHGAARELEAAVARGQDDDEQRLLAALERALNPVLEGLSVMESDLQEPSTREDEEPAEELDQRLLAPMLRELLALLEEGDPEAAGLLATLTPQLAASAVAAQLEIVEQHVENFDFDDAVTAVVDLGTALGVALERSDG